MQTTAIETALITSPFAIATDMSDERHEPEAHEDVFAALFAAASGQNGFRFYEAGGELHIVRE